MLILNKTTEIKRVFKEMGFSIIISLVCIVFSATFTKAEQCVEPRISSNSYTTQDAFILREIAYVVNFHIKCKSGDSSNLYALIGNTVTPVAQISFGLYEISWTEEVKGARTGNIAVSLYDESGYAVLKKTIRNNEDISVVPVFAQVSVNHPGIYSGPWLSCEFLAVGFSIAVAYAAIHFRTKLLN